MPTVAHRIVTTPEAEDEASVLVRVDGSRVGLTLSLRSDGDVEIFFGSADLAWLIQTLSTAQRQLADAQHLPHE